MSKLIRLTTFLFGFAVILNGYGKTDAVVLPPASYLEISASDSAMVAAKYVSYLVEDETLSSQSILANTASVPWQRLPKPTVNMGKQENPIWVRFGVTNDSDQLIDRVLEIRWTHLSEVDFYQKSRHENKWVHYQSGLSRDKSKYYQDNTSYLFPITLEPNETAQVLVRVHTNYVAFLPMIVWPQQQFQSHQKKHFILYSLAFGILIAMCLYNASLYIFTRDRLFLYYSFYVVAVIVYEVGNAGIGNYLLWGHSDWMRHNMFAVSVYAAFLGVTLFIREFLDLKKVGGWHLHCNTAIGWFWLVGIVDQVSGLYLTRSIAGLVVLVICIILAASVATLAIKGSISARYFSVAWSVLVGFTVFNVAMTEGLLPYSEFANYGQIIGFVLEMLLLSFALADRINRERRQREKAQAQAIELQKMMVIEREEKIDAQEEILSVQKKATEELEGRVKERTLALELTMENLKNTNLELSKLSITDPLTNSHNRRYFDEMLEAEIKRSHQTLRPLSLILVDVDHFKQFNDRYGHLAGDDCLKLVAAALSRVVSRETDLVARFGGEEFAIIMPETSEQQAYQVAEKIRVAIESLDFICKGEVARISASLGIAGRVANENCVPKHLIEAADRALYEAKDRGRNCTVTAQIKAC